MKYLIYTILFLFLTAASVNDARKANEAFRNGNYAEAVELYKKAIGEDPENARLHFNLGNAYARLGNIEEAQAAYGQYKALSENEEQQSLADYNTGNIYAEQQKYDEAIEKYREALKKNPGDEDAKHNYELALQKKQQQEDQQQQQQNQDENKEQDQDQQQQQQQQNQDQQDQQQQQQNEQSESDPQDSNQQQQAQQMSLEEAKRVLDALEQREKELLKNMKKESSESNTKNDKDW